MNGNNRTGNDEEQRILKARARVLAREPAQTEADGEKIEIVEFLLADERYALEARYIGEILPLKDLTPLPCTPAFVLGIINLRGRILSVIDLRPFFDLPKQELSDLHQVIVLRDRTMEFGLRVDAIIVAGAISRSALLPSLPTLTAIRADYLLGVTAERLIVLHGGKILTDSHMIVHEEV